MVVFITTFIVNVVVVTLWPDGTVDWYASAVIAGAVAITLTLVERGRGDT